MKNRHHLIKKLIMKEAIMQSRVFLMRKKPTISDEAKLNDTRSAGSWARTDERTDTFPQNYFCEKEVGANTHTFGLGRAESS